MGVVVMTPEQHKAALAAQLARSGGHLPNAPDGPLLECFDALGLAQAIEHEMQRADECGFQRIEMRMALPDAQEVASFLRRAALAGV